MEQGREDNILKYATYTILYANDLACNCIKDLKPFISHKDKETQKIYGALLKRATNYLRFVRGVIKEESNNFLADYNSVMDDINDESVVLFKEAIINAYKQGNISEYEFLGNVEVARSMFYLSIATLECLVDKLSSLTINSFCLNTYSLKPYSYIMDNFVKWCYRFAEKEMSDDLDLSKDEDVMKHFVKINENLLNYESFDKCYNEALKLANN